MPPASTSWERRLLAEPENQAHRSITWQRMAGHGAGRAIANSSESVGPAQWAAQDVGILQVGQYLLGGDDIIDGELVLQGALLDGTVDLCQMIDAGVPRVPGQ